MTEIEKQMQAVEKLTKLVKALEVKVSDLARSRVFTPPPPYQQSRPVTEQNIPSPRRWPGYSSVPRG